MRWLVSVGSGQFDGLSYWPGRGYFENLEGEQSASRGPIDEVKAARLRVTSCGRSMEKERSAARYLGSTQCLRTLTVLPCLLDANFSAKCARQEGRSENG